MDKDYVSQAVKLLNKSGKKYIVVAAESRRKDEKCILSNGFSAANGNVQETFHMLARFLDAFAENTHIPPKDVVSMLAILYMMKGGKGDELDDE